MGKGNSALYLVMVVMCCVGGMVVRTLCAVDYDHH